MQEQQIEEVVGLASSGNHFIQANTVDVLLEDLKTNHIIPVFTKYNEPLISHADFICSVDDVVKEHFSRDITTDPAIKVSHPIKGRIPEAKNKPAKDLQEHEKTLYYERMAFMVELPLSFDTVGDNTLQLTVGGIKAYNLENYNSSRKDQRFKIFIGFKNTVCTNLCISTDGVKADVVVRNVHELKQQVRDLFARYNAAEHLEAIKDFNMYELNEPQVVHLLGRLKMFHYLPHENKRYMTDLRLTESQLNGIADGYYNDPYFRRGMSGSLTLWQLYNLLTGAAKSTYIDQYLDRLSRAHLFVTEIQQSLEGRSSSFDWYLKN
jgi:hypothetical protein